jgi:N-acetylneuraminic acid mutarotase
MLLVRPVQVVLAVLILLIIVFVLPISMAQRTTTTIATAATAATAESFWTSGAPMPTPRTEVTAAVLEDDIYVIGGFDELGQTTDIVEVYNIANNTWSKTAAPLPEPLHHTAAASYDGKIYVVGGFTAAESPSDRIPTNRLFIYDPIQNNWQEGTPMPTARGALNVNFINSTLYAIGGRNSDRPLGSNEAYDPSSDTWTSKAAMPTARHHAGSAVVDGKIFVIGGRITGSGDNLSVNEAYDPEQDTWIANLEAMPSERSGAAAVSLVNSSNIYVFGGEEPSKTFNNNERYDARTNEWTSERPMQLARHGLAAVYAEDDGKIYVIGGGPHPGLTVSSANEIFHINE